MIFVAHKDSYSPRGPFVTIEADNLDEAIEIFKTSWQKSHWRRLLHVTEHWEVDIIVSL